MIISASYKTDIPAFYGEWFMHRLRAGYCAMINAYNQKPVGVSLHPSDVEGITFWTKNIGPFLPHLDEVRTMGFPFVIQHTINGYAQSRFEAVVSAKDAVRNVRAISEKFGPRVVIWRYDPIVLSSKTLPEDHIKNFTELAEQLTGVVDEVVCSFVQPYQKTRANMARREERYEDFAWIDGTRFKEVTVQQGARRVTKLVDTDAARVEKHDLAKKLAGIAMQHGLFFSICSQETFVEPQYMHRSPERISDGHAPQGTIGDARCVDTQRLLEVAQSTQFAPLLKTASAALESVKQAGNRGDCACYASRDIGDYDTCPYGCAYCYAVSRREVAQDRFKAHVPTSVFLDPRMDAQHAAFVAELPAKLELERQKRATVRGKYTKQPPKLFDQPIVTTTAPPPTEPPSGTVPVAAPSPADPPPVLFPTPASKSSSAKPRKRAAKPTTSTKPARRRKAESEPAALPGM